MRTLAAVMLLLLLASRASAEVVVATLPPQVAFADWQQRGEAEAMLDLLVAKAAQRPGRRWVERQRIDAVASELGIDRLGGDGSLAIGRGVGADLVILPMLRRDGDAWQLQLSVIDPEKADVLASFEETATPANLDAAAVSQRLDAALSDSAARLAMLRAATPVAVLFFANTTGTERFDAYRRDLTAALYETNADDLRMLRFPNIGGSEGEQRLALAGLTRGAERWQDVARWWVWGEFREVDWEGKPFEEAAVEVTASVWDGEHEPTQIVRRGGVAEREKLAAEVAAAVTAVIENGPPAAAELPQGRMAERLVEQVKVLRRQGGDAATFGGVTPAWLARWRYELQLLELAKFLAPESPTPALEFILSRYRSDLRVTTGPGSARSFHAFGETESQWRLGRAVAWGDFVERFGFDAQWSSYWPREVKFANGPPPSRSSASQYLETALEVFLSLTGTDGRESDGNWPVRGEALRALRREWADELLRRTHYVIDAARRRDDPSVLIERAGGWRFLESRWYADPRMSRQLIDLLLPLAGDERRQWLAKNDAYAIRNLGDYLGDPAWAAGVLASLPTPSDVLPEPTRPPATRRTVARSPSTLPTLPKLQPLENGIAYDGEDGHQTVALAARGDAWLALATGYSTGGGLPLFYHAARPGEPDVRQVNDLLGMNEAVAFARRDNFVWITDRANGVARLDLATGELDRFGLDDGLTTTSLGGVTLDPAGLPVVVSGSSVQPPTMAAFDGGRWIARPVETFHASDFNPPTPKVVAADDRAVLVAGGNGGVNPFLSRFDRKTQAWTNRLETLVAHLDSLGCDFTKVMFGKKRFNARAVVALPGGGFLLVHDLGVTHMTDAGEMTRTRLFGYNRYFTDFGDSILSDDGKKLWIAGSVHRGSGACLIELDVAGGDPPTFLDVPRQLVRPRALAQRGDVLLVGGETNKPPDVLRFPLFNGSLSR